MLASSPKGLAVYQGLFLIAFALYSAEKNKVHAVAASPVVVTNQSGATAEPARDLQELFQHLKRAPFFEAPIDGLGIQLKQGYVQISIQSDELYRDGEIAPEETWYAALDQLGRLFTPGIQSRFQFNFVGFANHENDAYRFSGARAEWIFHYFESKFRLTNARVTAAGSIPNGRRVEIHISEKEL